MCTVFTRNEIYSLGEIISRQKNTKNKREAATSCAYDIKKREEKAFVCKIDSESRIEDSSEVKSEWRVRLAE